MFFSILAVLVSLAIALPENCTDIYINEFHYDNLWRDSRVLDFVEIAAPAGTSLDGYEIMTWNGEYGTVCGNGVCEPGWESYTDGGGATVTNCYRDCSGFDHWVFNSSDVITDMENGWGVLSRRFGEFLDGDVVDDLPDGLSDGILLVNPEGNVVQFITYEGHAGSSDFGTGNSEYISSPLSETDDVASILTKLDSLYLFQLPTVSIQLQGSGYCLEDFSWEGPGSTTPNLQISMSEGEINNDQEYFALPSSAPSVTPTVDPSNDPSTSPSVLPSVGPSSSPSVLPTNSPSTNPSFSPSFDPSVLPTCAPSTSPSVAPTTFPSTQPSVAPSVGPSVAPSTSPSTSPSVAPSTGPSGTPSVLPTVGPSTAPSTDPSASPVTSIPTTAPSTYPSTGPSTLPSTQPSVSPSVAPSTSPTVLPSGTPSVLPSTSPSGTPSVIPSVSPSTGPSTSPSYVPSATPSSSLPTTTPSEVPSLKPFLRPTVQPSVCPSDGPSVIPSTSPSNGPSVVPTSGPSTTPSVAPTNGPSVVPSCSPSTAPTVLPSVTPSTSPSVSPSTDPTVAPSAYPSTSPSVTPSVSPSTSPSSSPSVVPSTSPSTAPSVQPSFGPSVIPTTFPSYNPSVIPSVAPSLSPTIEACGTALHRRVGSNLIVLSRNDSSWDDDNDQFSFSVHLPMKYTANSIVFEGASNTANNYDSVTNTDDWTYAYRGDECLHVFDITVDFDDIKDSAIVTLNDGKYYYTGSLKVTSSETFNHDIDPTQVFTRQVVQDLVWILQIEDSVELTVDVVDIYINNATAFHVFTKYSVLEHDGTSSDVTIRYQTEVNYPWVLDSTDYDFVDESPYGIPYTSKGVLTENSKTNCGTGFDGQMCVQEFEVTFPVSDVCAILGNWTVKHYAVYESETQEFDFTAVVSLESVCATTITDIDGQATLDSYESEAFTTPTDLFQIGTTAYFKLVVDDTIQTVNSIVLESVEVENMDNTYTCTTANGVLNFVEISVSTNECTFSLDIEVDKVKGDETAAVRANVVIDYVDRRQRRYLTIDLGDARRALIDQESDKRLLMYVDKDNKVEVEQVIFITEAEDHKDDHCFEDGVEYKNHAIYESKCPQDTTLKFIKQCTEGVWGSVLNQCSSFQSEKLTSESLNTESNSVEWEIIFFSLLGVTILGVFLYGTMKMCQTKVMKQGDSLTPKKTNTSTKPVLLNIQHETHC